MKHAEKELKKNDNSSSGESSGGAEDSEAKVIDNKKNPKQVSPKAINTINKDDQNEQEKNNQQPKTPNKNEQNEKSNEQAKEKNNGLLGIAKIKPEGNIITENSEQNILSVLTNLTKKTKDIRAFADSIKKKQTEFSNKFGIQYEKNPNVSSFQNYIVNKAIGIKNIFSELNKFMDEKYKPDDKQTLASYITNLKNTMINSLPTVFMHQHFGLFGVAMILFYFDSQIESLLKFEVKTPEFVENFLKHKAALGKIRSKPEDVIKILVKDLKNGNGTQKFKTFYRYYIAQSVAEVMQQSFMCGVDFNSQGYKNTILNLFKTNDDMKFLQEDVAFMKSIHEIMNVALKPKDSAICCVEDVEKKFFKKCNVIDPGSSLYNKTEGVIKSIRNFIYKSPYKKNSTEKNNEKQIKQPSLENNRKNVVQNIKPISI